MVGQADRNLRSGTLSEDLGVVILSSFSAVAPVPRSQDVGIDVICTLLRPEGTRALYAEGSFYVQIKSVSVSEIEFLDNEYVWLKELQLPLFIGIVDKAALSMGLYTSAMAKIHFIEGEYRGINFMLDHTVQREIARGDIRLANFGPPVVTVNISDITDSEKVDLCYQIVKVVIDVDETNRELLRLRSMKRIKWDTNQIPVDAGQMTLVNVDRERYEHEVLQEFLEIIRASGFGLVSKNADLLASMMPIIERAHKRDLLTKADQKLIRAALTVLSELEDSNKGSRRPEEL